MNPKDYECDNLITFHTIFWLHVLTRISRNWTISAKNPKFHGQPGSFLQQNNQFCSSGKLQSLLLMCFESIGQMQDFQFSWQLIPCKGCSNRKYLINDFASHSLNDQVINAHRDDKEVMSMGSRCTLVS